MKTHSRMLRGYDNNQSIDRSAERHTAPSATMYNKNRQKKFRESTFSKPSLYVLPRVYSSKKR